MRQADRNKAAYAALACAVALPSLVWLVQTIISAEGSAIGGDELESQFRIAALATAGLAAAVGWLQVQVLLGRMLERRIREFRLVMLLSGSPRSIYSVLVSEAVIHGLIGWFLGGALSIFLASLATWSQGAATPSVGDFVAAMGIALTVALAGVLPPSLLAAARVARLEPVRLKSVGRADV
ncbi:MAG TPA: hypothetical protein VMG08_14955 [Allosphingosinicella sp.]|nr:hypothetical protein [Allosphingosinicella sp.]